MYTRNWQIFVLSLALLLLGFDIGVGCLAPPQPLYSTRDGPGQLSMLSRNEHKLLVRCHPCENISLAASNQSPLNSSAENLCLHTALLSRDLSRKASAREVESRRDETRRGNKGQNSLQHPQKWQEATSMIQAHTTASTTPTWSP